MSRTEPYTYIVWTMCGERWEWGQQNTLNSTPSEHLLEFRIAIAIPLDFAKFRLELSNAVHSEYHVCVWCVWIIHKIL